MRSHFLPASTGIKSKRSHLISGAAIACATALIPSIGAAQVAYDSAGNPIYGSGWSAGQNGGSGFGAWSFDSTSGGGGQEMSSSGAIGTAWTLYTTTTGSGISDVGRSISEAGGLQVGQTFQTVVQNPTSYHYFGGFDILFLNGTDNNAGGVNTAAIRAQDFHSGYYNPGDLWSVQDSGAGGTTSLSAATTGAAGVQIDLTLNSATAYTLTMTALNGGGTSIINGTYSGPINYVNFRLYDGVGSSGPTDVADNFGISYMEIEAVPEPTSVALFGLGLGGLMFLRRKK
jgi:PEP-CTERM motif-containing protein